MAFLQGTLGNDTLIGTTDADTIYGFAGNDNLVGLEADDLIFGNQGNDIIDGSNGNDVLYGGKDNDEAIGNVGQDTLFGDLGNDTCRGGDGDDLVFGDQNAGANFGGFGDDILFGEAGNDTLFGLDGFDRIEGNVGNDYINGNQGNDTVSGGEGNDNINGGQDNDLMFGDLGEDTLYGDLGNDSVAGGEGRDLIFGIRGDDSLVGESGDDEIYGNQGNDTCIGGEGNDVLYGGQNNDLIRGDAGNDLVSGDRGVDTLTGGDGNDIFLLRKNLGGTTLAEADILTDFANGADLFRLIDGLRFEELNIFQGTEARAADTIIQDITNGQFLAVLTGINRSTIERTDFVVPGTLAFSAPAFQVNENGTTTTAVTVTRTDGSDGAVSVTVTPTSDTATAPEDYNNAPIVVNFAAGETSKTVAIPIVDDAVGEYTETINLTLGNATGSAQIGTQNTAVVQIVDNDSVSVPRLTFLNPTPESFDQFGASIAAVGNNVLIGAFFDSTSAVNAGAAYLFDGNTGALLRTFLNPTPNVGDRFGDSVAAVGNNVLIGAPGDDTGANGAGAAYLFDGNTGALLRTFLNPTPNSFDSFGASIAAVGNNVLIGALFDSTDAVNAGAAYLFDGNTGALLRTFLNPTPDNRDYFGSSIAAVGNNVLIGTPNDDTSAVNAGAAYLFDGNTGALLQTFLNPTPNFSISFGSSIAAVGNNVLIGRINGYEAYLFDGNTGALLQTFLNPTPNNPGFGSEVAAIGNNVLIGSPFGNTGGVAAGAAYLF